MMLHDGSGWFRTVQDGSGRFRIVQDVLRRFRNLGKVRNRQRWILLFKKNIQGDSYWASLS